MSKKIKHSLEFKIAIVKEVLRGNRSIAAISADNLIHCRTLSEWLEYYQRYGRIGLMPQSNHYSVDMKLNVIKSFKDNNLSLREACLKFSISSRRILKKWLIIYEEEGVEGLAIERRGRHSLMASKDTSKKIPKPLTDFEKILEENKFLKAENALLKKLQALIQREELEKKRKR